MKKFKKVLALILTAIMVLGMSTMSFAADENGSITITNAAVGKEYSIYKLFDATVSDAGISYKVPEGKSIPEDNAWFSVDAAGNVSAKEDADITTKEFATWAESFGTQVGETVTAEQNTVVFDKIPYGYYFVKSSLGSLITVDSTTPDAEVIDKNPTEPVIPEDFKTAGDETAQLGDVIDFTVEFKATNYVTKDKETTQVTEYIIEDAPTALAIDKNTIKVTINKEDKTEDKNVSIDVDDNGKMTITLKWAEEADDDGVQKTIYPFESDVKIEYKATVTNAGVDGIKNEATIKYNDTEVPTEVEVKTYQITLKKVNEDGGALDGAQFEIRRNSEDGAALALVDLGNGEYRIATDEDETSTTVIKAGTAVIKGLDGKDKYYLKETLAPEGYNVLTTQTEVVMNNADQTKTIENKAGVELPSTGGIGTTIFYVLGSILVIGAGVLLVTKRRMDV